MSGKRFCLASLVAAVLGLGSLRAEEQPAYVSPMLPPTGGPAPAPPPEPPAPPGPPLPSRWVMYDKQPGCCGPMGANGPITYELYARSGIAFPVANSGLGSLLDNGWVIEGGVRTLFFNPNADADWAIDLGIGNEYNRVGNRSHAFQLVNVPNSTAANGLGSPVVTGSDLNRTYFIAGLGRDWYLMGSAEGCSGTNWRVGVDVGGHYGSDKLDLNEIPHRTSTLGATYVAAHTDVEVPWGQCIFQAGVRLEYGYTWEDVLQSQNNADVQDLSIELNFGIRF